MINLDLTKKSGVPIFSIVGVACLVLTRVADPNICAKYPLRDLGRSYGESNLHYKY